MLAHQDILPLITTTSEAFSEAMKKGIGSSPMPSAMRSMLQNNVFIFSGFKTHAQLSAVSALLLDDKGKKKPFDTFLQDVKAIDKTYNQTYLRAEYNFATQSARSAAQWADYQKDGDMFNLQYRTAGDERVRESHMLLNHTTLPLSDPFWKKYFPPNGWNCRCTAVQVRKSKYPLSDSASAIAFGEKATTAYNSKGRNALAIFRFNPGIEHKIFPPRHPYLPKPSQLGCDNCSKNMLAYNPKNSMCQACRTIHSCLDQINNYRQARKDVLDWGRHNIIGKYEVKNDAFDGLTAKFCKESFTHNLSGGGLFDVKVDILNNIETYIESGAKIYRTKPDHDLDKIERIYKQKVRYNGAIKEFKGRDVIFTYRKTHQGDLFFYDIKIQ